MQQVGPCLAALIAAATTVATIAPAGAQPIPTLTITERDRTSHPVGERVGVEVILDVGAWPAAPAPGGTLRIGATSNPDADCVIQLPAHPPLGCLWGIDTPGTYQIVAHYSGDATYPSVTSSPMIHEVAPQGMPERVSIPDTAITDRSPNRDSTHAKVSADGRWVLYISGDPRLTIDPTPVGFAQALLLDRKTGVTRRMSSNADGSPANRPVIDVALSGNGRFAAFLTDAQNLLPGADANSRDWYIADRDGGMLARLDALRIPQFDSVNQSIALSDDGRYVAFDSLRSNLVPNDTNEQRDVFRLDRIDGSIALVSRSMNGASANGWSSDPSISADGQQVAFASRASDLVAGDTDAVSDAYVADLASGVIERVSLGASGAEVASEAGRPRISPDGRFVAFQGRIGFAASDSDGVEDVFVRDRVAATTTHVSREMPAPATSYSEFSPTSVSTGGRFIAIEGFLPQALYLHDAMTGQSVVVAGSTGATPIGTRPQRMQISADGSTVTFESERPGQVGGDTTTVIDVYAYDVSGGALQRASQIRLTGSGTGSIHPAASLSSDGSMVAFASTSGNLVEDDTNGGADVFVRDRPAARTRLITRAQSGAAIAFRDHLHDVSISANGRWITFKSQSGDIAPADEPFSADIFLHDRETGSTRLITRQLNGRTGNAYYPAISGDGRWVTYASNSPFLTDPPICCGLSILLHDAATGVTIAVPEGGSAVPLTDSTSPRLSFDGRHLVFSSTSNLLVPGDTNGQEDVFVYDRLSASLKRLSVNAQGQQANAWSRLPEISADGSTVVFVSAASNLVAGDTNGAADVFAVSVAGDWVKRISVGTGGVQGVSGDSGITRPGVSGNGRFVVFDSSARGLAQGATTGVDAYVVDRATGATRRVLPNAPPFSTSRARSPSISADGRVIAFASDAALPGSARHADDIYVIENPTLQGVLFADSFDWP